MIKHLDHIGVAVKSLDSVKDVALSAFKVDFPRPEGEGDFKASWVKLGNTLVEFMEPIDDNGVIGKFLKNRGEGIHHLCFEVDNIDEMLADLKAKSIRLVNEAPLVLEGRKMAFIHPKSADGVLIELYEINNKNKNSLL